MVWCPMVKKWGYLYPTGGPHSESEFSFFDRLSLNRAMSQSTKNAVGALYEKNRNSSITWLSWTATRVFHQRCDY